MIKSNFIKIIFLLFLGATCAYPRISYAGNCTEERHKEIVDTAKKQMNTAIDALSKAADKLKTPAEEYLNKCKKPALKQKPINSDAAVIAKANGVNFDRDDIWVNTGYEWEKEEPPAGNATCADLLKSVRDILSGEFTTAKIEAETAIKKADAVKERDNCVCDAETPEARNICIQNAMQESAKEASSCKRFDEYEAEFGSICLLCPIFEVILNTISQVSAVAWRATSGPLSEVVKVIFLILLALEVLKAVAAVAGSKITALAKGVLVLSAKVAFTVLLLSESSYIYNYFLSPVLEGGLEMGVAIANASSSGGHCAKVAEKNTGINSTTFSPSLYNTVLSTVDCFGKSAAVMPAIGRGLTCNAWKDTNYGVPNLTMWFSGAIMYVLGVMIWLAISFYMIDCTVQLGMLGGLVPLLIACWPFKLTETYTFKGCKMLMNSFFTYAMIGIVLLIGTTITTFAIGGADIQQLESAINNDDIEALKKLCDFGAIQILTLIACAIFAMKLIGQTGNLADQFSKGGGSDIGTKLGGTAASMATGMAKSGGKTSLKALGGIGKLASDEVGLTAAVNKGKDKITGAWHKGGAAFGKVVGLGKFQNKQIGSGLDSGGTEGGTKPEDKENQKPENTQNQNQQNNTPGGGGDTPNPFGGNDTPNPDIPGGGGENPNPNGGGDNPNPGGGDNPNPHNDNPNPGGGENSSPNTPGSGDDPNTKVTQTPDGGSFQSTFDEEGNESWKSLNADGSLKAEGVNNKDGSYHAKIYGEDGKLQQENSGDKNGTEQQKFYKDGKFSGSMTSAKDDQGNTHWNTKDENGKMLSSGVNNTDGTSHQFNYNKDGKVEHETHHTKGATIYRHHKYDQNGNLEQPREGGLFHRNKK